MKKDHLSLVLFTILVQTAVGMLLMLGLVKLFLKDELGFQVVEGLLGRGLPVVLILLLVSMTLSLLHLGSPINAPLAILNLGRSWLSAEISFTLFTTLTSGCLLVLRLFRPGLSMINDYLLIGSCICGLLLIVSMIRVYCLRTVPSWNNKWTWIQFSKTTLLLGTLAFCAACLSGASISLLIRPAMSIVILMLGIDLTQSLIQNRNNFLPKAGMKLFSDSRQSRLGIALIGSGVIPILLFWAGPSSISGRITDLLVFTALGITLLSELKNRRLFYLSYESLGISVSIHEQYQVNN
jgi:DMSO reductase anchor subunit